MNTPEQQATLYRKAAETIEMCAEHGIEPFVKFGRDLLPAKKCTFNNKYICYEFPLAVIEGQLVWADTVVYNCYGELCKAGLIKKGYESQFTLIPPKQPLCTVEGKPVYKGDKLWYNGTSERAVEAVRMVEEHPEYLEVVDGGWLTLDLCSWNPPKPKTVMVELLIEDAEAITQFVYPSGIASACRTALDNLKA